MVLESTVICVDNSEYMRNGDFPPTRLQAQQEAVGYICQAKIQLHPQNNVGLLTLAHPEVLATLTSDVTRLISKLHQVQPSGDINFLTAIRIAHLVLKHRLGKTHRMRIVAFVGSPVETDLKDLTSLAKSLKKEKVNVDIVNFGEETVNTEKLSTFISTLNGEDGSGSHLVTVPSGDQTHLSDALISSPVIQGEYVAGGIGSGSGGFEYGIDPNEDPELAMALRVSMEEQRLRQEEAARRAMAESAMETDQAAPVNQAEPILSEERLLQQALAMSMETEVTPAATAPQNLPDFSAMTEEEQIAYAMQMSIQQSETNTTAAAEQKPAPAAEDKLESQPEAKKVKLEEKQEEKEQKKEEKKEDKKEDKGDKKDEKEEKKEEKPEDKPGQKVEEAQN